MTADKKRKRLVREMAEAFEVSYSTAFYWLTLETKPPGVQSWLDLRAAQK